MKTIFSAILIEKIQLFDLFTLKKYFCIEINLMKPPKFDHAEVSNTVLHSVINQDNSLLTIK